MSQFQVVAVAALMVFALVFIISLFARLFVRRYLTPIARPALPQSILDGSTLVSFAMSLVFFVFGDKDVLVFLPFAAIAVATQLERTLVLQRWIVTALCVASLAGTAVWTREDLCRNQAVWTLAERVHASGVPTASIYAGWEWAAYYHFEDYARSVRPQPNTTFSDFFERWVAQRRRQAEYLIVHDPRPPAGEVWRIVDRYQYLSVFSRGTETFYAVKREQDSKSNE